MKKVFLLGGIALALLAACSKKDNTPAYDAIAQFDKDSAIIVNYLKTNNITASHDPRSIFYQIIDSGDVANKPTVTSNVTVKYLGTFLDGKTFDSNDSIKFDLNRVIGGWQIGIPLIGKGGRIKLFLPSYYAYGPGGSGSIPPNTVLLFDVTLKDLVKK
ncbi:FKBP-type peptidyl-prolyl cis-trans isomerase [Chitinophaga qingshengii]|uniref:Peptidyl-prolyl cis-trans isomerase n=1 Tax=Chitinophaga qingshengii TaxID=1569794 RepID=A0ABR7TQZ5_9BACT|nr:FKBP-type peptidyl-prolyl cis-trans isomerase [Chitinophaga qingshengii]MBC9931916.1 FKBP-type peptidyl-prolyl cis-trans isomerase [Chitinophaga qingshengii]